MNNINIEDYNDGLSDLLWDIEASEKEFSLIFAVCNYNDLQKKIIKKLHKKFKDNILEINLHNSWTELFNHIAQIKNTVPETRPKAYIVMGLACSKNQDQLIVSANQLREEFRKNIPFPLILWINDKIAGKLIRLAPDIETWGTLVRFDFPDNEFFVFFQKCTDKLYKKINKNIFSKDDKQKLKQLIGDLTKRNIKPDSRLDADFNFIQAIIDQINGYKNQAVIGFEKSLNFWKKHGEIEKQCTLLTLISQSYQKNQEWENALNILKQGIDDFKNTNQEKLTVNFYLELCKILLKLEKWDELEPEVQQLMSLIPTNHQEEYPKSQVYMAEVFYHQKKWDNALEAAQEAEKSSDLIIKIHANLIIARAFQNLNQPENAVKTLEQARIDGKPETDPCLYINILELLHKIYFEQKEYFRAFKIKQEKYSIEQEFGFRAFIGAGRLKARRKANLNKIEIAEEIQASGRKDDVDSLIKRIKMSEYQLIVIHGQSGVGKSSILEAGILPALKQITVDARNVLPVLIRTYTGWTDHLGQNLAKALKTINLPISQIPDNIDSIIKELKQNDYEKHRNLLTVLLFDQFEEFFFANTEYEQKHQFYDFLKICLNISYVKVILSLREDYLHYLLDIPELELINNDILGKKIRYSLGNFTPDNAKQMITSLSQRTEFHMEPALIDKVVQDLSASSNGVRPIELQIVGSQLQEHKITTLAQYKSKEYLIKEFLEEVLKDCGDENKETALMILYLLTDETHTRPLKTRSEIKNELTNYEFQIDNYQFNLILTILTKANLLFLVPGNPARFQIVHDYLATMVQEQSKLLLDELENRKGEKEKKKQKKQLRYALTTAFMLAVMAIIAVCFAYQANLSEQQANYNLARVYEEKAGIALKAVINNENFDKNFQKAWLYTLEALNQEISENKYLPVSLNRLIKGNFLPEPYKYIDINPDDNKLKFLSYNKTKFPDFFNTFLKKGKKSFEFKEIYKFSHELFSYTMDGISFVPKANINTKNKVWHYEYPQLFDHINWIYEQLAIAICEKKFLEQDISENKIKKLSAQGFIIKGEAFAQRGKIEEALSEFKKALELNPDLSFNPADKIKKFAPITNSLGMQFAYIEPGTFIMGSPLGELGRVDNETQHKVSIIKGFYIQTTEVTQEQWESVMKTNPSYFRDCGKQCPVEGISWHDIQIFIQNLNNMEKSKRYRLPTEAEWEYACRAGSPGAFANGDITGELSDVNLDKIGWYDNNSNEGIRKVAQKLPNVWGLYDMHGNVSEWCDSVFQSYSMTVGSINSKSGSSRAVRGGSWISFAAGCRSSSRHWNNSDDKNDLTGFRLVLIPNQ